MEGPQDEGRRTLNSGLRTEPMHGQLSRRNPTTAQTLSVVARFYFRQLQKLLKLVEPPGMTTSDFATTYLVHILHLLPHAIRIKAFEALEHPESTRRDVNRNTRKKEKDHWWCVLIISGSYLLEFGPGLWELSGGHHDWYWDLRAAMSMEMTAGLGPFQFGILRAPRKCDTGPAG